MKLELFREKSGQKKWRFRLVARNGEIWQSGQRYSSKSNARRAARTFRRRVLDGIDIVEEGQLLDPDAHASEQEMHVVVVECGRHDVGDGRLVQVPYGVTLDSGTSLCIPQGSMIETSSDACGGTTVTVTLLAASVEYRDVEL